MGNWSFARILAPLALIAAVVGIVVVVQAARPESDEGSGAQRTTQTQQQRRGARPRRRVYVVRAGDNLTLIAERTGVPLARIERLNPSLDAQTLSVGQRLRLTR
jgi:LysM repeat protein